MTSILKNVYINKLDDIVNKYNNTYHSKIKMKPADVKLSEYIDFNKENSKEDPKFNVGDHVRILIYKNIFARGYILNWRKVFVIKKLKMLCSGHMLLVILIVKKLLKLFIKKNCKKTNQKEF